MEWLLHNSSLTNRELPICQVVVSDPISRFHLLSQRLSVRCIKHKVTDNHSVHSRYVIKNHLVHSVACLLKCTVEFEIPDIIVVIAIFKDVNAVEVCHFVCWGMEKDNTYTNPFSIFFNRGNTRHNNDTIHSGRNEKDTTSAASHGRSSRMMALRFSQHPTCESPTPIPNRIHSS